MSNKRQECPFEKLHTKVYFCSYCGDVNNKKNSIIKKEQYQKRTMPRMKVTSYKKLRELDEREA